MLCTLIGNDTIEFGLGAGISEEEKSRLLHCVVLLWEVVPRELDSVVNEVILSCEMFAKDTRM
jgi:hypothetical protein